MLSLRYVPAADAAAPHLARALGVFGYGAGRPDGLAGGTPFAALAMPSCGEPAFLEVWSAGPAVVHAARDGVACATAADAAGELLFGLLSVEQGGIGLEDLALDAYRRVFGAAEEYHLLRLWNYLPGITDTEAGTERYRLFNRGRARAFLERDGRIAAPPAASALGSGGGPVVVGFLAAQAAGLPVENPRQMSAYRYPPRYGSASPTFSRAVLHTHGLFVSGTASIVGHASRHAGDVAAQTAETCANLRAVLAEAGRREGGPPRGEGRLKVYVRDPADLPVVRPLVAEAFPEAAQIVHVNAAICRPELLVEIEAAYVASRES